MLDSVQESWTASSRLMADPREESLEDVAGRCRLLWRALDHASSAAFAAWLGVSATRWNNVENTGNLSKELAFLLQRKIPGMRVEWLWFGDRAMMPDYLLRKLDAAEGARISTTRSA